MSLSSISPNQPLTPPPKPPNRQPSKSYAQKQNDSDAIRLSSNVTVLPPRSTPTRSNLCRGDSIPTRMVENVTTQDANGHSGVYNGPVIVNQAEEVHLNPVDDPDAPPPPLTDISLDDEKPLVPHGKYGQMVYVNNGKVLKFTGDWDQGHWTKGTCLYTNGNVYSGSWNKSGQPHGPNGKLEWVVDSIAAPGSAGGGEDMRTYQGDWHNGMRHGQGTYAWSRTGAIYQGAFVKNQRQGYGTYRDPSSKIEYVGEWKQGVYHGYGQYTWRDASQQRFVYRGTFNSGHPHGHGIQVNEKGEVVHEGEWSQGKPVLQMTQQKTEEALASTTRRQQNVQAPIRTPQKQEPSSHSRHYTPSQPTPARAPPPPTKTPAQPRTTVTHIAAPSSSGKTAATSTPQPMRSSGGGAVTVVQDREWMDTVNQAKPNMGVYRGLWLHQNPFQNGVLTYETGEVASYEGWFNSQGYFHGQDCRLNFRNGDCYQGDFEYGQRHGKGLYTWKDGRQYKGQFIKNSREGKGTLVYPNSDFYEGEFVQGKRHGRGRFIFANGSMYEGQWYAGQYHGYGTLVQTDGSTYVGNFERGVKHGKGKDLDQAGALVYEGNYWRGKTGDGPPPAPTATKGNASTDTVPGSAAAKLQQYQTTKQPHETVQSGKTIVESYWVPDDDDEHDPQHRDSQVSPNTPPPMAPPVVADDEPPCQAVVDQEIKDCQGNLGRFTGIVLVSTKRPHGVGRLVYADGKRIHEGFWKNGSKEGHGRCLFFPQGDFHEGEYQNNLRNGPGRYQWKDGRLFIGHYKDDMRHGQGVFTYPSGDRYDGIFSKGQRSGYGIFQFAGGVYEGEWHGGKYHGRGKLKWGRGSEYEGEFSHGMFHGSGVLRDDSGQLYEKGRWFKGKRVASENPHAPPPAAAPPPPPTPPAAETPQQTGRKTAEETAALAQDANCTPPQPVGVADDNHNDAGVTTPNKNSTVTVASDDDTNPTTVDGSEDGMEMKMRGSTPVTVESFAPEDDEDGVPMSSPPAEMDIPEQEGEKIEEAIIPRTAVEL